MQRNKNPLTKAGAGFNQERPLGRRETTPHPQIQF